MLEYVAEKIAGNYGDRAHRLKAYVRRLDPRHLLASSLEAVPPRDSWCVDFAACRAELNSTRTKSGNQTEAGKGGLV